MLATGKGLYGFGTNRGGKWPTWENGKRHPYYIRWRSMIMRCYQEQHQERLDNYRDCWIDGSFKDYQDFAEWFDTETANFNINEYPNRFWSLDKDILGKGDYGKDSCIVIPISINNKLRPTYDNNKSSIRFNKNGTYSLCTAGMWGITGFKELELALEARDFLVGKFTYIELLKWEGIISDRAYSAVLTKCKQLVGTDFL